MTQPPMNRKQRLQAIQKRHEALLLQSMSTDELKTENVRSFINTISQAGTIIKNADERSSLRDLIRYWSSFISDQTGEVPIVELQPFVHQSPMPFIDKIPRPINIIVAIVVILALSFGSYLGFSSLLPKPSPSSTTLCLATDLPENGTLAAEGRGIRRGVELALQQSSLLRATYHGYQLTGFYMDDSSQQNGGNPDPTVGAENLQTLFRQSSCPNPIAVIGPYTSSTAPNEIPVAAKNHLLLLSPSNTAPCLTQKSYSIPACKYDQIHPQGFPNTYARLSGTDIDRGYLSADFLVNSPNPTNPGQGGLGAQRIEIVGDEEIYGTQVSQAVTQQMGHKGVTPIGIDCIKLPDDYKKDPSCSQLNSVPNLSTEAFSMDNIAALAAKIRDEHADAVFFGGFNIQGAGLLRENLGELGLDQVAFVGTGGALVASASTFFGTIGSHATNTYSIITGADPSTFTSGAPATFSHQYQSEFGISPDPLSTGGYDAANIVIEVTKGLIDAGKPVTKENVVQAVLSGNFTGVLGNHIKFDQNGDNIGQHVYTIYQSQQSQGTWNWQVFSTRQT